MTGMKTSTSQSLVQDEMDDNYYRPPNPVQKLIIDDFCKAEVEAQARYLAQRYGLKNYEPTLILRHNPNAAFSYGGELQNGEPYISLALHSIDFCVGSVNLFTYTEYPFLKKLPDIGDAPGNWKQYTAWLIAHELSHTLVEVERFKKKVVKHFDKRIAQDVRDHGRLWQEIYRDVRKNFCTPDRYPVEALDFSGYVFCVRSSKKGQKRLTFYKGREEIAHFIRDNGKLYRCNSNFGKKRKTTFRNARDVQRYLVTA